MSLLLSLFACVGNPDDTGACGAPELTLLSPEDGATVDGDPLVVDTETRCFTLIAEGGYGDDVPDNVGHIHVFLNGQEVATGSTDQTVVPDVAAGVYQLRVELALENHEALDPYVGTTIYISVD